VIAGSPILVLGSKGQLARALACRGAVEAHPIVCRGRPVADIADAPALQRLFAELAPLAVVNAAAFTAVDAAEANAATAYAVNAEGPEHVGRLCRERQIPLIQISTDYVFDGAGRTPYRESDAVAPLCVYGASKAAGEDAIRRTCPQHLILRTAWLYGMEGRNFLTSMIRLGTEREELSIVDDQRGSPTWTEDAAAAIITILRSILAGNPPAPWGTYHLTGGGETTWFGFAREIFGLRTAAGHRVPRLKAITAAEHAAPARRPTYSVLDNGKIGTALGIRLRPWQKSLAQCMGRSQCRPSAEKVA